MKKMESQQIYYSSGHPQHYTDKIQCKVSLQNSGPHLWGGGFSSEITKELGIS